MKKCWCGAIDLKDYSHSYLLCNNCNTLVSKCDIDNRIGQVLDEEKDFYGKNYWQKHVSEDYNLPNIEERVIKDIPERCTYWIKHLLKYRLPEAKVLEIGCGPGSFVYMMKQTGYEATGIELSQEICNLNRNNYDIDMLCGNIESLDIEDSTYDIIAMMDVLEHLVEPKKTLNIISQKLKDDGLLVIQTPCYKGKSYDEMVETTDIFVQQLKETEHVYLYNKLNIQLLLKEYGFTNIAFEKQLFEYDMFLFASKTELKINTQEQIVQKLSSNSKTRMVLALMDLYDQNQKNISELNKANEQGEIRLNNVNTLTKMLEQTKQASDQRLNDVNTLTEMLKQTKQESEQRLNDVNALTKIVRETEATLKNENIKNRDLEEQLNNLQNKLHTLEQLRLVKIIERIKKK